MQEFGDSISQILYEASQNTWSSTKRVPSPLQSYSTGGFTGIRYQAFDHWRYEGEQLLTGMCFDGIGTKVNVAERLDRYETLGFDLVAMVADDASAIGATPLCMGTVLDVGNMTSDEANVARIQSLATGLTRAAMFTGVPVINGEFAQMGMKIKGEGALSILWNAGLTWIANRGQIIDGSKIAPGDTIVALQEKGARSNGFTLLQETLRSGFGTTWPFREDPLKCYEGTLGELVLTPSTIYTPLIQMLNGGPRRPRITELHGIVHVTGGGMPGKLKKLLDRTNLGARIDKPMFPGYIFNMILELGLVDLKTAYETWNMGHGMLVITDKPAPVLAIAQKHNYSAQEIGIITDEPGIDMTSHLKLSWS